MNIGIAGYGTVGRALARFFERGGRHRVAVYDKYREPFDTPHALAELSRADLVFVAVPTPFDERAGACDLSAVYEVVRCVDAPVCIKSTIPPGSTEAIARATGKRVAFSPEYLGESPEHPWREPDAPGFLILAGDPAVRALVRAAYDASATRPLRYAETDPRTAELVKYMENCFLATKVAFANQFAQLAARAGVPFDELRALFLLDARVSESHTTVTAEGGFAGRCLPKDLAAIVAWSGGEEHAPLLQAVIDYNTSLRAQRV